jgi:CRISPR system Cascade subunit CasE
MTTENAPLFLHRIHLDQVRLLDLGRRRHLPAHSTDMGYLVHCQMMEMFGECAPIPFQIQEGKGRGLVVLAYSPHGREALLEHADAFADPAINAALDRERFDSKRMPDSWAAGRRLGFHIRICPVVRVSSKVGTFTGAPEVTAGAETDAYLSQCWWAGKDVRVDREQVYRGWLEQRLQANGAIQVLHTEMTSFRIGKLLRRDHETDRKSRLLERPEAEFTGEFEVRDPLAFQALLMKGVGRHKSFGFGMLLLRPPRPSHC